MFAGHQDSGHANHQTNGHQRQEPHMRQRGVPGAYSANILASQMDRQ